MSAPEYPAGAGRVPVSQTIAGFLAAAVILISAVYPIAYILDYPFAPGRIGPGTMLVALVAAGMGGRHHRLAGIAVAAATAAWFVGMVIAVTIGRPLF